MSSNTEQKRLSIPLSHILGPEHNIADGESSQSNTTFPEPSQGYNESAVVPPGKGRFFFVNSQDALLPRGGLEQKAINSHVQQAVHRQRRFAATEETRRNFKDQTCSHSEAHGQVAAFQSYSEKSIISPDFPFSEAPLPTNLFGPECRGPGLNAHFCPFCGAPILMEEADGVSKGFEDEEGGETQGMKTAARPISKHLVYSSRSNAANTSPVSLLDSAEIDPFATASVPMTRGMNAIFHYFLEVMIPGIFPIRRQAVAHDEWAVQLAFSQPQVLFAILAVSAAAFRARTGQLGNGSPGTAYTERDMLSRVIPDFVEYKIKAIKIVNQKMATVEEAVEASTIYTVMCLLAIETITGNEGEVLAHVSGMEKLIALRGGYHGLPAYVVEMTLITCYMCAAMTGALPPAPPVSSLQRTPPSTLITIMSGADPSFKEIGHGILNQDVARLFNWKLIQAFRDMRELILYREYYHQNDCTLPAAEVEYFSVKSYNLRYLALSIPFDGQPPASNKQESCRIALLIFWNANDLAHHPDSAFYRGLTTQLKSALELSDLQLFWNPHHGLLMWILFLGAHISAGQRERPWFVMNLARGARLSNLREWEDVKKILMRFFYIDRVYLESFMEAWEETRMVMDGMPGGWFADAPGS